MLELMQKGGPVMWVIFVVSVIGVAVFFERIIYLHRAQVRLDEFLRGLANLIKKDRYEEARTQCLSTPGPVARVALSAVLARECARSELRDIVQEAGQLEVPRLERHLLLLTSIVYIAPLLGLLGTVLGLLEAFYLIHPRRLCHCLRIVRGDLPESDHRCRWFGCLHSGRCRGELSFLSGERFAP